MSSTGFANALDLRPRPSLQLLGLLAGLHLLAMVSVISALPRWEVVSLVLAGGAISGWYAYQHQVLRRGAGMIRRVVWQADGRWILENNRRQVFEARLQPYSFLHARLVILNFIAVRGGASSTLVLLPDSLDFQTFRQLRQRLRIAPLQARAKSPIKPGTH